MLETVAGWAEFGLALLAFFGSHAIPSFGGLRLHLIERLGRATYLACYSVISMLLLIWLIAAAARAPFVELWPFEDWQRLVPAALMPVASCLVLFGLLRPNPLSLSPAPSRAFDPEAPGVAGLVRHPILWATLLWSISHLPPNGDVAHVILFTLFAALSITGMIAIDARRRAQLGPERWSRMAARTSLLPGGALLSGWRPRPTAGDVALLCLGLAAYVALVLAHPLFAGVPAMAL